MGTDPRVRGGGQDGPLLLLLHGLGATGDVWAGWADPLARHWAGRRLAPDLPGHGRSPELPEYTFDALAEALIPLLAPEDRPVVLGHSLGGVVALALAARVPVSAVVGLGVKVTWSEDDLARAAALARRPVTWFDTREEAVERHLRLSGLSGLVTTDSPAATSGVREEAGRWRPALDPRAFGVGAPDMAALLRHANTEVCLARGADDPMNTDEQLKQFGVPVVTLPGLGHNAHVESPAACLSLLDPYR
ncbi:alpha/beta fold hydrolase [Actinoplanes sichuanensis]|uniref:Alpha/beta fold hydrolase n=1 Tax=Actinoplanes sichuanensis TaxID=512349 RepID=A0ABW4AJV7_9ACTN|nr:alpha/beta hydrolase [Actinoplanes sichuanensis]BEL03957.1 alpha/beta fold hydrolase [Actinoplanes sichuanensis]